MECKINIMTILNLFIKNNFYFTKLYIFASLYFIIFDYKFFGIFGLVSLLIFSILKIKNKLTNFEKKILISLPFIFYLKKLYIGLILNSEEWVKTFWEPYSTPFVDLKVTLRQLVCQKNVNTSYFKDMEGYLRTMTEQCAFGEWRYGPLFHLIKISFNSELIFNIIPIFVYLIFFYFLFLLIRTKILNEFEFSILSLSPLVNFALTQLNLDIIFFVIIFLIVSLMPKSNLIRDSFYFILSLLKQHPVGLLIGSLYTSKKLKNLVSSMFFISMFILINLYILRIDTNFITGQPRPSGGSNASGLLTIAQFVWINYFDSQIGFRLVLVIYLFLVLIMLFLLKYFISTPFTSRIEKYISKNHQGGIVGIFILTSAYANYDYRNIFLLFLFLMFDFKNLYKNLLLFLFMLSPIPKIDLLIVQEGLYIIKFFIYFLTTTMMVSIFINTDTIFFKKIQKLLSFKNVEKN